MPQSSVPAAEETAVVAAGAEATAPKAQGSGIEVADDRQKRLKPRVRARLLEYAQHTGWLNSVTTRRPVDRDGTPLPWYTYAAINFLDRRVPRDAVVFEFGSGHSTLWWSARVASVSAVEHDARWHDEMSPRLPRNVTYRQIDLDTDGAYAAAAAGGSYDIIIVDGRDRVNCCRRSLSSLTDRGVVIWDNSDRSRYRNGFDMLAASGFRRLDFIGNGPINTLPWETAIFYRPGNLLGL